MTQLRRAVLKVLDPSAFEDPLVQQVLAHERRLAGDPVVQARNAEVLREHVRNQLPWFGALFAVNTAMVSALAYWLPWLFSLEYAVVIWLITTVVVWFTAFPGQSPAGVLRAAKPSREA